MAVLQLSKHLLLVFLLLISFCDCKLEPYRILGVDRQASNQEIRKAYKNLAKEWHPDKNNDPNAQSKFVEINSAYELLSDTERRKNYDQHGIVDDQQGRDAHPEWHKHHQGGFRFHFGNHDFTDSTNDANRLYKKQSITYQQYYSDILPQSTEKPYIILFFSDWCFTCLRIEPIWSKLTDELEPVGFGVITVHSGLERDLARKIGSNELPHIALLMDGKVVHYKDPQFSALRILDFVRSRMPYKLVESIDQGNIENFLNGWHDNRIRVLLFGKTQIIRLRYLTTAFKFRPRAKLGYVQLTDPFAKKLISKYNVGNTKDSMLVFHEDSNHPVAFVSMEDLSLKTLFEVIESHQFLILPRLSSQIVMDQLCPPDTSSHRKRLCVVLINSGKDHSIEEEEQKRSHLRNFIQKSHSEFEQVQFAYVLKDMQSEFVKALSSQGLEGQNNLLNLAIVWRKEDKKLSYEWFDQVWSSSQDELTANKTENELRAAIQRLSNPNSILSHEVVLQELLDEHASSLPFRIINRILEAWDRATDTFSRHEILPIVGVIAAVVFILILILCLQYAVSLDDEENSDSSATSSSSIQKPVELKLIEFKAETYNGLLRLQMPGCRTLVLILDRETKDTLGSKFFKTMWPYRKNKTLNFAYMFIEKGQGWFMDILQKAMYDSDRTQNINPKNCVGTVLALNAYRRYFCMYHAKHPEGQRKNSGGGSFLGFDEDSDDEEFNNDPEMNLRQRLVNNTKDKPIRQDELLDGLPLWLDRLFEGSTMRYYISTWPEFPVYQGNIGKGNQQTKHKHMHEE